MSHKCQVIVVSITLQFFSIAQAKKYWRHLVHTPHLARRLLGRLEHRGAQSLPPPALGEDDEP